MVSLLMGTSRFRPERQGRTPLHSEAEKTPIRLGNRVKERRNNRVKTTKERVTVARGGQCMVLARCRDRLLETIEKNETQAHSSDSWPPRFALRFL